MQMSFLQARQALDGQSHLYGLWLLHGDEPLLQERFLHKAVQIFKDCHQSVSHLQVSTPKDWALVLSTLLSGSLFGEGNAVILSGKQKCRADELKALEQIAQSPQDCLIYCLPKQDKKAQNTPLFQLFLQHGTVVDCHIYDEKGRAAFLKDEATRFGLSLNESDWQLLLSDTEANTLAGYQTLWRLSFLGDDHLKDALVSDYHFSVYVLAEAYLAQDTKRAMKILAHLKNTNQAPSLVLWALAKEIRTLLSLRHLSYDQAGVWQKKIPLYRNALAQKLADNSQLDTLYAIDKAIKGLDDTNPWQALERLLLTPNQRGD